MPSRGRGATTSTTVVWSDTVAGRQGSNMTSVHVIVLGIVGLHHVHSKMDLRLDSMYVLYVYCPESQKERLLSWNIISYLTAAAAAAEGAKKRISFDSKGTD